jgi:hypothetical protein
VPESKSEAKSRLMVRGHNSPNEFVSTPFQSLDCNSYTSIKLNIEKYTDSEKRMSGSANK